MKLLLTIAWLVSVGSTAAVETETASPSLVLKQKLGPMVQQSLERLCGEDCPGFKIEPVFQKNETQVGLEDLGFPPRKTMAEEAPLKAISVRLLVKDSMPQAKRDRLRKTLAYRTSNATDVPVSVSVEPVPVEEDAKEAGASGTAQEAFALAKALAWPAVILVLGFLSIAGLVLGLRHHWAVLCRTAGSLEGKAAAKPESTTFEKERKQLDALLAARKEDLAWLMESAAETPDSPVLGKIAQAYPADVLSNQIHFSDKTLAKLAALEIRSKPTPLDQVLSWMEKALDEAHWSRKREEKSLADRLSRYGAEDLKRILHRLPTAETRAFYFASVSKDAWPDLLSSLESASRIELGASLGGLQRLPLTRQKEIEGMVDQGIAQIAAQWGRPSEKSTELVQDYSLYLSEEEGHALWMKLSAEKLRTGKPPRLESILMGLSDEVLLEIYMNLDLESLKAGVRYSPEPVRRRILGLLPEKLRERISHVSPGDVAQASTDPDWIKARAHFLRAYRTLESSGGATH